MTALRLAVVLACLALAALAVWPRAAPLAPAASAAPVPVTTAPLPPPADLPVITTAYGSIAADPASERLLAMPAPGIVAAVHVAAGQAVRAGDLLVALTADPLAAADLTKARDAVRAAAGNRAHIAALLAARLATRADLALADQALDDARAALRALQATGAGRDQSILAPCDAVVTAVTALQGAPLPAGAPLVRLAPQASLRAQLQLAPGIGRPAPGENVQVRLLGGPASLPGVIASVAASLDPQNGLLSVTVAIKGQALIGAPVAADLQTGRLHGIAVPNGAVLTDETGDYIFQVAHGIAQRVGVTPLGDSGDRTVLAPAGLEPGLPIVIANADQLDDGEAVLANGAAARAAP